MLLTFLQKHKYPFSFKVDEGWEIEVYLHQIFKEANAENQD
jgi:hypothetical protein